MEKSSMLNKFKYGDIISLKYGVRPQMSLDAETFFSLSDDENEDKENNNDNDETKVKTYWGLPEDAFETDDMGFVYLKSEYAKKLRWGVDDVTRIYDESGRYEHDRLNINVAYDPEGYVNAGAFCSFVDDSDVERK